MQDKTRKPLYVPDWEPIASAAARLVENGAEEAEAHLAICAAVADRKVNVRATTKRGMRAFEGGNVGVPKHLRPDMINWKRSQPFEKWWIGPLDWQSYAWPDGELEQIELLEVRLEDVNTVFIWQPVDNLAEADDPLAPYKTGGPGAPSPIQHIEREAERRRNCGEALLSVDDESKSLHEWCKAEHPKIAAPKPGTIANRIRSAHRNWKASRSPTE